MKPKVSYKHVMRELSVNRKDPCEVLRELISNSYDAKASTIHIYPLLQYQGFIFFDDGIGISQAESDRDPDSEITPYESFFSIGLSTKTPGGTSIGYKCQGSKLCFASSRFALITRCQGEKNWRWICIDNPRIKLDIDYPIDSEITNVPAEVLSKNIIPDDVYQQTQQILNTLNERFFQNYFNQGTMIIVQGLDVDDFS